MILSLDASLALLLTAVTATAFLQVSQNFDFSVKEIAAQKFTDSLALSLQEEKTLLMQLADETPLPITGQVEEIQRSYCIVVKAGEANAGNCTGREKVTRQFFIYSDGDFVEASVETYFG